jgi:hypothetical protein
MLPLMVEIWITSFTIDVTADSTTFLERVADYADRQGYTDLESEKSLLIAKRGWISGSWSGAATAPFEQLESNSEGEVQM